MSAIGTIQKILNTHYQRTAPAEQQQMDNAEPLNSDYKNITQKNMADITGLMTVLGPLVQSGIVHPDQIKASLLNPTKDNIQALIDTLTKASKNQQQPNYQEQQPTTDSSNGAY